MTAGPTPMTADEMIELAGRIERAIVVSVMDQNGDGPIWAMPLSDENKVTIVQSLHRAAQADVRAAVVEECIRAVAGVMQIVPESGGGPIFDALRALASQEKQP